MRTASTGPGSELLIELGTTCALPAGRLCTGGDQAWGQRPTFGDQRTLHLRLFGTQVVDQLFVAKRLTRDHLPDTAAAK
jgi:hypothetical protein